MLKGIKVYDGEILLAGIAVFIHPFNIISAFTVLFKKLLGCTANKRSGKAGGLFLIGIAEILNFFLTYLNQQNSRKLCDQPPAM